MTGRIVVGADGSPASQAAVAWAAKEAALRGGTLVAVYAWTSPYMGGGELMVPPLDLDELEGSAKAVLDEALQSVGDDVKVERVTVMSPASAALLEAAKDADLVVVGSRGHGGFTGLLLGSVSHQVSHHSPVPVVIVPHHERG